MNNILKTQKINSSGYGIIPKLVMQDQNLTIQAKAIYAYFCSFAGQGDTAFPSVVKICCDLKITRNTYYKHLDLLKNKYISIEHNKQYNGKFYNNCYILLSEVNV
jgi:hypothetical protein